MQGFVDRNFYRARYDAAETMESFAARIRHDVDVEQLTDEDNPLTITGHDLVLYELDARLTPMEHQDGERKYYGAPVRMRYITQEQ